MFPATVLSAPPATSSLLPACVQLSRTADEAWIWTLLELAPTSAKAAKLTITWSIRRYVGKGMAFLSARPTQLGLPHLEADSEAHRDREFPTSSTGYSSH